MAQSVEASGMPVESVDQIVVQFSSQAREAAWEVIQALPAFSDEQLREPAVQAEIVAALAAGVPGWTDLVLAIERGLDGSGLALVRGARFDPENRMVIGLTAAYSRPSNYGHWKDRLVYDLFPIDRPPGASDFETFFHTGSQSHDRPHEIQVLQCVRAGTRGGGVSQLVQIDRVLDHMREHGQQAQIDVLSSRAYPFLRPKFMGELVVKTPIIWPDPDQPGRWFVRFQREVVFDGAKAEPASYDAEMASALEALEAAWNTPGLGLEYTLQADEYLTTDNRRVLHARTAVMGGRESGRHLKRIKAYRP